MIPAFSITGSQTIRPPSKRTLFVDGSADKDFRENHDLELSHWVPNRTPTKYKADTSTEICFRFLDAPASEEFDLAVNNHVDVDGMLSVFTLTRSERALEHRATVIGAAEMGDFSACGPLAAQRLFQGLTLWMQEAKASQLTPQQTYEEGMHRIEKLLSGEVPRTPDGAEDPRFQAGLDAIERGQESIESAEVMVAEVTPHFTLFLYPLMDEPALSKALKIPAFNALLDDSVWLWPQSRNRFDGECVQLVTIPVSGGFHHDLWYPGYMWAETPDRWRAPGFEFAGSTNGYRLEFPALEEAVATLQNADTGKGTWVLADQLSPFQSIPGRGFPVVLSYVDTDGNPAVSSLDSQSVAERLENIFR